MQDTRASGTAQQSLRKNLRSYDPRIVARTHTDAQGLAESHLSFEFQKFIQALIWNGGSRGRVRYDREICTQLCACRYILFVTVVTSWWLGITFGNAAYFAVITFTTVGLGDFAPPSRPASRRRVDGVGLTPPRAHAGSSTTTQLTRTWSASTCSSPRRRCWVSCCSHCS